MENWYRIEWYTCDGETVDTIYCHESELAEVCELPFPSGACVRSNGIKVHHVPSHSKFFRRTNFMPGMKISCEIGDIPVIHGTVVAHELNTGEFLIMENTGKIGLICRLDHKNPGTVPISRDQIKSSKWDLLAKPEFGGIQIPH